MTLLDIYRAEVADIRIATNYRASGHTADMLLAGRLLWDEVVRRWESQASLRAAALREKEVIHERIMRA